MQTTWSDDIVQEYQRSLFINRDEIIANFKEKLAYQPGRSLPVIMLYGIGGIGKTWLVNHLKQVVCKDNVHGKGYPSAVIKFSESDARKTPDEILGTLSHEMFDEYKFSFPRFAGTWHYYTQKITQGNKNTQDIPTIVEIMAEMADIVLGVIPSAGTFVKAINVVGGAYRLYETQKAKKQFSNWYSEHFGKPKWGHYFAETPKNDLLKLMPDAFACDLEDAVLNYSKQLAKRSKKGLDQTHIPNKAVLFIDGYELLQTDRKADDWIRGLVSKIVGMCMPILLVVSGNDRLRWAMEDEFWKEGYHVTNSGAEFNSSRLEIWQLKGFDKETSKTYLAEKLNINNLANNNAIEEIYSMTSGIPLALNLYARLLSGSGGAGNMPINQVHKSVYETIIMQFKGKNDVLNVLNVAAIPRWFDQKLLLYTLGANAIEASRTIQLSSLVEEGPLPNTYRIHDLVRDAIISQMNPDDIDFLEKKIYSYFSGRVDELGENRFFFIVEQVYHQFRLDQIKGYELLAEYFKQAMQNYIPQRMRLLLGAVPSSGLNKEIELKILRLNADLLSREERSEEDLQKAEAMYREILSSDIVEDKDKAPVMGHLAKLTKDPIEAESLYEKASKLYESLNNRREMAIVLQNWGNFLASNDLNEAIKRQRKSAEILNDLLGEEYNSQYLKDLQSINNDMAMNYLELFKGDKKSEDAEKALEYLQVALDYAEKADSQEGVAYTHATFTESYIAMEFFNKSLEHWIESAIIAKRLNHFPLKKYLSEFLEEIKERRSKMNQIELSLLAEAEEQIKKW